jgi:hypothetical protein
MAIEAINSMSSTNIHNKQPKTNSTLNKDSQISANGDEKIEKVLLALSAINKANIALDDAKGALNGILDDNKKQLEKEAIRQREQELYAEYEDRLKNFEGVDERLELIRNSSEKDEKLLISKTRSEQFKELSDEQLAALGDDFLKYVALYRANSVGMVMCEYENRMEGFDFLKSLTPEQLIKLQADKTYGTELLFLLSRWVSPQRYDATIETLQEFLND